MAEDEKKNGEFSKESLGEKFEVLTNASPDCIKLFNLENKIEFMSPGGLKEHGFKSLEEAIGFDWMLSIVPEQREEIHNKIQESMREKKTVNLDVKHLPEFANREWCNLSISPVFDENGGIKYFLGISRDISDRKKMEEKIRKSDEEQKNLNNFMVNRELKMVELKQENARMEAELEAKSGGTTA